MSERQNLAEHGTALCIAALGLTTGGFAALVPVAVLAMIGLDRWSQCDAATLSKARNTALKALEDAGDISEADASAAAHHLKTARQRIRFEPARMIRAMETGDLPRTLTREIFGTRLDDEDPGVVRAVSVTLEAAFDICRKSDQNRDVFTQEAVLAILRDQKVEFAEIKTEIKNVGEALGTLASANRDLMEALAWRFEIMGAYDLPDAALRQELEKKAEDYRALRREVDGIDPKMQRLSNLKAAAQDALDRGDFDEVDEVLLSAQTIELEEAAKTAELRAETMLLRGRVEEAYRLLSVTADSFAGVDPLEPARRRILSYFTLLRNHGLRYGGPGLPLSRDLLRPVLTDDLRSADAWLWGAGENWRGNALADQGSRTGGEGGTRLLEQAVAAYASALEVITRADHPVDWAMTQNNLGATLRNQGARTGGEEGTRLLGEAVVAFRSVLEVYTRADHPVDWAMTQNNLGNALQEQGTRPGGAEGARLLGEAVTAYRAALEVRTRADHPVDWAQTQNNLGTALQKQGTRTDGEEGARLLGQAVAAYRAALEVLTRADHPVQWATTQNNLGIALQNQGTRTGGEEGARLLGQAVAAYRSVLEVYTRADHPVNWATTQNNLGTALQDQGSRTGVEESARLLRQAVAAYRSALEVRTRADHPVDGAMTRVNMAKAEQARAELESCSNPREALEAALAHVEAALEVFDPEHMSYYYEYATRLREAIREKLAALD